MVFQKLSCTRARGLRLSFHAGHPHQKSRTVPAGWPSRHLPHRQLRSLHLSCLLHHQRRICRHFPARQTLYQDLRDAAFLGVVIFWPSRILQEVLSHLSKK
ncbi:unnamed protein product [Ixodes persulcatus]